MAIADEMLVAYADGELSAAEAAEVERAIADDEALATKLAFLVDSRIAVKRAHATPPAVSAELEARVRALAKADAARQQEQSSASNVVDLASRRRVVPFWQLPAAAAVALAVGATSGWFAGQGGNGTDGLQVAGLNEPAIATALSTVASGARIELGNGAELAAIVTFRDGDGALCREFEHDRPSGQTVVAVACRADDVWDVKFAIAAASADAEGYAPASSLETLDAYLSATGAGAPLSPEEESSALATLD